MSVPKTEDRGESQCQAGVSQTHDDDTAQSSADPNFSDILRLLSHFDVNGLIMTHYVPKPDYNLMSQTAIMSVPHDIILMPVSFNTSFESNMNDVTERNQTTLCY